MSIIEEINNLNSSLKAIALNIFLVPFWYVSIFLFNNEFYKSSDSTIIITMCVVLSLVSAMLLSVMFVKADEEVYEHKETTEYYFAIALKSIVLLCIWISILIFIVYSLGFIFNIYIYFYYFMLIYFAPLIILSAMFIIETFAKKTKKNI